MPLVILAIGGIGGFFAGNGVSGISNIVKYGAIAGVAYLGAKWIGIVK